jgi:Trypsin-like peptidase domain/Gram-negative bacterial TonB protein C-terminal
MVAVTAMFFLSLIGALQTSEGAHTNSRHSLRESIVAVVSYGSDGNILARGSGFFVSERGDVLTRRSLIPSDAARTEVITSTNKVYSVKQILVGDDKIDLVRVSLDVTPTDVRPLPSATFSPQFGDRVFFLSDNEAPKTIDGVVTTVDKSVTGKTFRVSASSASVSTGTPIFNVKGQVAGVVISATEGGSSYTAHVLSTDSPLYPHGATFQPTGEIREDSGPGTFQRSDQVFQGTAITRVAPSYPAIAKFERVDGTIVVEVLVSETGDVLRARPISAKLRHHAGNVNEVPAVAEEALKQAAVDAVSQWKFAPTIMSGKPVKVIGTVTLHFHL